MQLDQNYLNLAAKRTGHFQTPCQSQRLELLCLFETPGPTPSSQDLQILNSNDSAGLQFEMQLTRVLCFLVVPF